MGGGDARSSVPQAPRVQTERERIPVLTYNRDYNAAALYNRGVYGAEFSPLANVKQLVLTLIYTQFTGRALFFR